MYKKCIDCKKLGVDCDGANLIALPADKLLEWCKQRKQYLKMSNAKIAELSNIPKGTIDRLFAGDHPDFRYESVRPLVKVLVGGFQDNPCPDPEPNERAEETIKFLEEENARIRKHYEAELEDHRKHEADLKKLYRKTQRAVIGLGIFLAFTLLIIIIALIIDRLYSGIGFFWLGDVLKKSEIQNLLI